MSSFSASFQKKVCVEAALFYRGRSLVSRQGGSSVSVLRRSRPHLFCCFVCLFVFCLLFTLSQLRQNPTRPQPPISLESICDFYERDRYRFFSMLGRQRYFGIIITHRILGSHCVLFLGLGLVPTVPRPCL